MYTDIICTAGPKSHDQESIYKMAELGMTIVRSNFSHCTEEEYLERISFVENAEKKLGKKIAILADLQGPRIRVKGVPAEGIEVIGGQKLTFVTNNQTALPGEIGIGDPHLHNDISPGESILIANGAIETIVTKTDPENHRIYVDVVNEGIIYPNKGVNMPHTKLTTSSLTEKDKLVLKFLNTVRCDMVALSFVRSPEDVHELRQLISDKTKIVVKIECKEALNQLDEIIKVSDAVMIARGDLGVEIPYFDVPIIQKTIIRKCHRHLKPSYVATQMFLSMVREPSPTRAEVSDVANAVYEGAKGVMLSDETANGLYPIKSVEMMSATIRRVEEFMHF